MLIKDAEDMVLSGALCPNDLAELYTERTGRSAPKWKPIQFIIDWALGQPDIILDEEGWIRQWRTPEHDQKVRLKEAEEEKRNAEWMERKRREEESWGPHSSATECTCSPYDTECPC